MTADRDHDPTDPRSESKLYFERTLVALLSAVIAFPVLQLLLAVRRGFDFTDEGLYVLSMQHPRAALQSTTQFQIPLGVLWWIAPSLPVIRVVKLVALLATGLALSWVVTDAVSSGSSTRRPSWERVTSIAGITLLGLTPYLWLPQTPGYNETAGVTGTVAITCVLLLVTRQHTSVGDRLLLIAVGFSIIMLGLAKWPAGVLFAVGIGISLWFVRRDDRRGCLVWVTVGAAIAAALTQLVSGSLIEVVRGMRSGSQDLPDEYRTVDLLNAYWKEVRGVPGFAVRELPLLTAAMLVLALALGLQGGRRGVDIGAAVCSGGLVAVLWWQGQLGLPIHSHARTLTICVGLGLLLILIVGGLRSIDAGVGVDTRVHTPMLIAGGALLLAPFALAVGTNNPLLTMAATVGAQLWGAGLVLLVAAIRPGRRARPTISAFVGMLGLATVFLGSSATESNPYRQAPLSQATIAVEDGPLAGLRVDPLTADVINTALEITSGLDNPFVIGMYKLPGVAAATGAVQPEFGWIPRTASERGEASMTTACSSSRDIMFVSTDPELEPGDIVEDCGGRSWVRRGSAQTTTGTELTFWSATAVTP